MRLLITGGAGFIGRAVVAACVAAGHEVRVLDALLPQVHGGLRPELPAGAELVVGDVRDPATVRQALRGVDAVSHHAAMVGRGRNLADAPEFASHNDCGTAVLIATMADVGVSQLLLASSVVVYGEGRHHCPEHGEQSPGTRDRARVAAGDFDHHCPICGQTLAPVVVREGAPLEPLNLYGAGKVAQEHIVRTWAASTGGSATVLRYHQVYGPGMKRDSAYSGVACVFRSVVQRGEAPEVFEDGRMIRDFLHVHDVARANVVALAQPQAGTQVYNVATGQPRTIGEVAAAIARHAGAPAPVVTGRSRFDDLRHLMASPERFIKESGWRPEVDFETGIREFVHAPMVD
jgi:dTDP-L-rhamnose 4-epimerase